jgi:TRAP-type C4-dicarboxylate transport system permease large subunit
VGACLYIGSALSGLWIEHLIRSLVPFYIILVLALISFILFPQLSQGSTEWIYAPVSF